ncbi:hypothetical protein T12_15950 [Trichinella patagoniensis]|uniref:Uncharacterized protein n=1 Tax=Trichinella patagoniensis TaxID=990121 RepID=A0A0V0Z608_9BILA|nr:hypothetical protein T12_15950 [Trichinella patagoniensis]
MIEIQHVQNGEWLLYAGSNVMQVCDYICAPPLTATNKVTDHEGNILQYCMIAGNSFMRKEE